MLSQIQIVYPNSLRFNNRRHHSLAATVAADHHRRDVSNDTGDLGRAREIRLDATLHKEGEGQNQAWCAGIFGRCGVDRSAEPSHAIRSMKDAAN